MTLACFPYQPQRVLLVAQQAQVQVLVQYCAISYALEYLTVSSARAGRIKGAEGLYIDKQRRSTYHSLD